MERKTEKRRETHKNHIECTVIYGGLQWNKLDKWGRKSHRLEAAIEEALDPLALSPGSRHRQHLLVQRSPVSDSRAFQHFVDKEQDSELDSTVYVEPVGGQKSLFFDLVKSLAAAFWSSCRRDKYEWVIPKYEELNQSKQDDWLMHCAIKCN